MKVFISSLISGMEPIRRAARDSVTALGHQPIMAENFGARPHSPQVACLSELRQSDVVVLILGDRYGATQPSGRSATHEEYEEARDRKPVLAFVQEGVTFDHEQEAFVREVQAWQGGLIRAGFIGPDDLQPKITRYLHEWQLANAIGSLDPKELLDRALALMPREQRSYHTGTTSIVISVAGGPTQPVLRPIEIEDEAFADALLQAALFGECRIFDAAKGSSKKVNGHTLVLEQDRETATVSLDEQGAILIKLPIERSGRGHSLPVLIQEDFQRQVTAALAYAGWLVERIDPTQRLTHVAIAAKITGGASLAWRTRREHDANPNQVSYGPGVHNDERPAVHLSPPHRARAALALDRQRIAEDLLVLVRRQWRG